MDKHFKLELPEYVVHEMFKLETRELYNYLTPFDLKQIRLKTETYAIINNPYMKANALNETNKICSQIEQILTLNISDEEKVKTLNILRFDENNNPPLSYLILKERSLEKTVEGVNENVLIQLLALRNRHKDQTSPFEELVKKIKSSNPYAKQQLKLLEDKFNAQSNELQFNEYYKALYDAVVKVRGKYNIEEYYLTHLSIRSLILGAPTDKMLRLGEQTKREKYKSQELDFLCKKIKGNTISLSNNDLTIDSIEKIVENFSELLVGLLEEGSPKAQEKLNQLSPAISKFTISDRQFTPAEQELLINLYKNGHITPEDADKNEVIKHYKEGMQDIARHQEHQQLQAEKEKLEVVKAELQAEGEALESKQRALEEKEDHFKEVVNAEVEKKLEFLIKRQEN